MDDVEVTPLTETWVTAPASTKLYVHMDEGFPRWSNDCSMLTRYVNYEAFRLWQGKVCTCYVKHDFIYN